jgi:hypothetical protein
MTNWPSAVARPAPIRHDIRIRRAHVGGRPWLVVRHVGPALVGALSASLPSPWPRRPGKCAPGDFGGAAFVESRARIWINICATSPFDKQPRDRPCADRLDTLAFQRARLNIARADFRRCTFKFDHRARFFRGTDLWRQRLAIISRPKRAGLKTM